MFTKNPLEKQKGFTMIEIIAVLILLGVLAAVAAPKYFNLVEAACDIMAESATASAGSSLTMAYAKLVLGGTSSPTAEDVVDLAGDNCGVVGSDFDVECTPDNDARTVEIQAEGVNGGSASKTYDLPSFGGG